MLTITVHAVNGTLGNGTATASIASGPGSFVGSPTCNYTGGAASASCTVTITSAVTGTTKVHATSDISFTNATGRSPGRPRRRTTRRSARLPAQPATTRTKKWVKAKITIAPDTTNEINQPHTFTATVFTDNGSAATSLSVRVWTATSR